MFKNDGVAILTPYGDFYSRYSSRGRTHYTDKNEHPRMSMAQRNACVLRRHKMHVRGDTRIGDRHYGTVASNAFHACAMCDQFTLSANAAESLK